VNQQQAIHEVASHAAGFLAGGDFAEATGYDPDTLSDADVERLGNAVSIVIDRLYRMGQSSQTKTFRTLTDAELDEFADIAEHGYDIKGD